MFRSWLHFDTSTGTAVRLSLHLHKRFTETWKCEVKILYLGLKFNKIKLKQNDQQSLLKNKYQLSLTLSWWVAALQSHHMDHCSSTWYGNTPWTWDIVKASCSYWPFQITTLPVSVREAWNALNIKTKGLLCNVLSKYSRLDVCITKYISKTYLQQICLLAWHIKADVNFR